MKNIDEITIMAFSKANNIKQKCRECDRVFDLHNEVDADEFLNGHDCEAK